MSPRKSVVQSSCHYDVKSLVIEETDKNFEFITEMLIRLLGFADPSCNRKPDFGAFFE